MSTYKFYQDSYDRLLKSGMFFEFHPNLTGDWYTDKDEWIKIQQGKLTNHGNEVYLDQEEIDLNRIEELQNNVESKELIIEDLKQQLEIIKTELTYVHDALSAAVENGVQINIGIVVGQTMVRLENLIYK